MCRRLHDGSKSVAGDGQDDIRRIESELEVDQQVFSCPPNARTGTGFPGLVAKNFSDSGLG